MRGRGRRAGPAEDVKALVGWLERDILALAGPSLDNRRELFDFKVDELAQREHLDSSRIRPVRVALKRQRDKLLGFAKVLDGKLAAIAQRFDVPEYQVRPVCLLQRKTETSQAYWQRRSQLNRLLGWKFHGILEAVAEDFSFSRQACSLPIWRGRIRCACVTLNRPFLNHADFSVHDTLLHGAPS